MPYGDRSELARVYVRDAWEAKRFGGKKKARRFLPSAAPTIPTGGKGYSTSKSIEDLAGSGNGGRAQTGRNNPAAATREFQPQDGDLADGAEVSELGLHVCVTLTNCILQNRPVANVQVAATVFDRLHVL